MLIWQQENCQCQIFSIQLSVTQSSSTDGGVTKRRTDCTDRAGTEYDPIKFGKLRPGFRVRVNVIIYLVPVQTGVASAIDAVFCDSGMQVPYVSPIACRCCPISLMMSLSVRDISLTAAEGSDAAAGWSSPSFKCSSVPFIIRARLMSSAEPDSCSDDLRLPVSSLSGGGAGCCCIALHSRSFLAGGGVQTVDDGVDPSTSLSDEEARLAMRPSTGRTTGP